MNINYNDILFLNELNEYNERKFSFNSDNLNEFTVNCLNQELTNLGFNCVSPTEKFNVIDLNVLFSHVIDIIKRYKSQLHLSERLQEQCHRLDKENEINQKRQTQLKESNESKAKEIANNEEKLRQSQLKINKITKSLKDEQDENRKLKNFIEQRDTYFKHERKKYENELQKLKEKLQSLISSKSQAYANIDLSVSLDRSPSKPRSAWNVDSSKKQLDVCGQLLKDYERRNKDLIYENGELKQYLQFIFTNISNLCERHKLCVTDNDENDIINNDEILNLPFNNVNTRLDQVLKEKLKSIEDRIQKHVHLSDASALNTTFTIESDEENESNFVHNVSKKSSTPSVKTNSSIVNNSSNGVSEYDEEKVKLLYNEMDEYRKIIKTQTDLINSFNQNVSITNEKSISLIEIEANAIIEERAKLAEEKKHHYKQKLQFEDEKVRYNQALLQLSKQRKSFEEEKGNFYKSQLYDSFSSKPFNNTNTNSSFNNESLIITNNNNIKHEINNKKK